MNCIEMVVKDEHGEMLSARVMNELSNTEPFTQEMIDRFKERLREEGFQILKLTLTNIQ